MTQARFTLRRGRVECDGLSGALTVFSDGKSDTRQPGQRAGATVGPIGAPHRWQVEEFPSAMESVPVDVVRFVRDNLESNLPCDAECRLNGVGRRQGAPQCSHSNERTFYCWETRRSANWPYETEFGHFGMPSICPWLSPFGTSILFYSSTVSLIAFGLPARNREA